MNNVDPYKDYEQYRPDYAKIKRQVMASLSKDDWQEQYQKYLQTDKWQEKRWDILSRDNYTCQGCLLEQATVVHHLTYANVTDELAFQLISLCQDCHARIHLKELNK